MPQAALAISAAALARDHDRLTDAPAFDLARALTTHDQTLAHAYAVARTAAIENRRIEPAAEWLIDNVYLIRNQIREVRETLSPRVWRRLPRHKAADGTVVPRILRVLRACIASLDGNLEADAIERYLDNYQRHGSLDMVELWTLPVLIRVTLIEGLAACAVAIARRLEAYSSASRSSKASPHAPSRSRGASRPIRAPSSGPSIWARWRRIRPPRCWSTSPRWRAPNRSFRPRSRPSSTACWKANIRR